MISLTDCFVNAKVVIGALSFYTIVFYTVRIVTLLEKVHTMRYLSDDITLEQARILQRKLAGQVITTDAYEPIMYLAGVDVGYNTKQGIQAAAAVLVDARTHAIIETATATTSTVMPYIPGFLSFREIPTILEAVRKLSIQPDLILCDGHGIAHPRRLGIASHLGVLLDIPTIGCGKKILVGRVLDELDVIRGSHVPLMYKHEQIGVALRTRSNCKPLYVSVGHRISLTSAVNIVLKFATRYRLADPVHQADKLVWEIMHAEDSK